MIILVFFLFCFLSLDSLVWSLVQDAAHDDDESGKIK
jgi:hypothetical protein